MSFRPTLRYQLRNQRLQVPAFNQLSELEKGTHHLKRRSQGRAREKGKRKKGQLKDWSVPKGLVKSIGRSHQDNQCLKA